jgi:hypothetical protein
LPALSVPAPQIDLLSTTSSTGIAGGFGNARTTVNALSITLPGITIPAAVQLPASVGALSVKAVGDVLTKPLVIAVGTMQDTASFRPGVQTGNTGVVPPAGGGSLTGAPGSNPTGSNPTGSGPTGSGPTSSGPEGSGPDGSTPNGTPTAGGPLPRTGLPAGAGLLALGFCAAGLLLTRRTRAA